MVTKIREYGDKNTIVVFTDDNTVLRKLREWKSCQNVIFYQVWKDCDPRKAVNVAVDLYFNKKEEDRLRKALSMPMREKKRSEVQRQQTRRLRESGKHYRFAPRKTEDAKSGCFSGQELS